MYRTLAESIISDTNKKIVCATEDAVANSCAKFLSNNGSNNDAILLRSHSDKYDYKLIELENGIRLVLISDPSYKDLPTDTSKGSNIEPMAVSSDEESDCEETDEDDEEEDDDKMSTNSSSKISEKTAAIVVGVKVGSLNDPKEVQGMAHMIEHLLTMGSEAYPNENEIDEFLASRGGYQNAHTEMEHTIYEIKVHRRYLKQAINLIGHSFVAPLLRQESIDREVKPIDTEFFEAANDDDVRVELLLSYLADEDHPMNKFMWGNRKSLLTDPASNGIDVRKLLLDFYYRHYNPENIVVVVQSQESLQNLAEWTVEIFSKVKSKSNLVEPILPKQTTPSSLLNLPYEKGSKFNQFYLVESINSGYRLIVNWCLPPVIQQYLSSPFDYLATLIGHEGKGSLIAELRKRDLAIDLITENDVFCFKNNRLASIFSIDLYLTDKGSENIEEIVKLLFEYISVIRKIGAQEYFFLENQTIALKSFNLKSEKNPMSYSVEIAKNAIYFPNEHILVGNKIYYHYDKKSIDQILECFLPEKANFVYLGAKLKPNLSTLKEPWMETKYQVTDVPQKWIQEAKSFIGTSNYFHYPFPNMFIAKKFDLLADILPSDSIERKQGEYPEKILDTNRISIWHKSDFKFNLPKASVNIHILSPYFEDTIENVVLSDIFFEYVIITLKEEAYDALAAELNWDITRTYNGIFLKASGFNDKLFELALLLLKRFKTIQFNSIFLGSIKKEVTKYYNNDYQDPEILNQQLRLSLLMSKFYTFIQRWPKVEQISKENLLEFKEKFLSNISFEILVQGNVTFAESRIFGQEIEQFFELTKQECTPYPKQKNRVYRLPANTSRLRTLTLSDKNRISYIVCYQQLEPYQIRSQCYLSLFVEMINELCFNILRTKEGLGYRVGCMENDTFGIIGFNIYVASAADKFDCTFVENRIIEFLNTNCHEYIFQKLNEKKFREFVSSAIKRKNAPDLSLEQEVQRNINEITSFDYCFDRTKKEVNQLQQATLSDFQQWTKEKIFVTPEEKKMLTIQVVGNGSKTLPECWTAQQADVCESMIPKDGDQCKPLTLLQAKKGNGFILDIDSFRNQLELYPLQKLAT